ncbi:MAG: hydrogenase formation protein HypD [Planctomycetes bacterium]|nr:hydrogenase formation protein HypD [Planctomycetota bacterium]
MKYVDEFRDPAGVATLCSAIRRATTRPHTLMEICGGQTHAIIRHGLDQLLPPELRLIHGPGCPVCVTPLELVDAAIAIAQQPGVVFCTFGDMLRVPGSALDLFGARARGADVRMVFGPLDAVRLAAELPERQVVFFAVGFETTAPATALAVRAAHASGLDNFTMLVSHVRVPPAIDALLSAPDNRVAGFLAAGHVCAVMGYHEYRPLAAHHRVPIVVTGFEPIDILQGVLACIEQLEAGRAEVENRYARAVTDAGNEAAQALLAEVFAVCDRSWRGIGEIPGSGLALRAPYDRHDALQRFPIARVRAAEPAECISGLVLRGAATPHECPAFGVRCTPERPLGAPMVSSEGACAAYHRYRRSDHG